MRVRDASIIAGTWFLISILAALNGVVREMILARLLGMQYALPLSGITLSLIVILVCHFMVGLILPMTMIGYLLTGAAWVLITLAFEYGFGYFVLGQGWQEMGQIFDIAGGNLFSVVLLVLLLAPFGMARLRGLV